MIKDKRRKWITLIITFVFIGVFLITTNNMKAQLEIQETSRLERALKTAALNCYVMEGVYPDSVEYLIDNYGIIIDKTKYHVFYEIFATNIMPDIRIYRKG